MDVYNIDYKEELDVPVIYMFGREGRTKVVKRIPWFKPYFYINEADSEYHSDYIPGVSIGKQHYMSIFGDEVRKIHYGIPRHTYSLRNQFKKTYEADIKFYYRFLLDQQKNIIGKGYKFNGDFRILTLDIETTMYNPLDPFKASENITSIALHDNYLDKRYCLVYHPNVANIPIKDIPGVEIRTFSDEKELLTNFLKLVRKIDADIWSGFNVIGFDVNYLISRMKRLGVNYKKMSPMNRVLHKGDNYKDLRINIFGVELIDILTWYRQLHHGDLPSYSLKNICKHELGREAKESCNPQQAWDTDLNKLIHYNVTDVDITVELEQTVGIMNFINGLREISWMNYEDVSAYSRVIDFLMLRYTTEHNIVMPTKPIPTGHREKVGGATVKARTGLFKNIITLDLSALYPTIIRQFNLSRETICDEGTVEINGIKIKMDKKGILPIVVEQLAHMRKRFDKMRDEATVGTIEYERATSLLDSIKCVACTAYGAAAYDGFRMYDDRIADTITFVGRELFVINQSIIEKAGHELIGGDTDSVFVQLNGIEDDLEKIKEEAYRLREEIHKAYNEYADKYGVPQIQNIDFEKVYRRQIVMAKKRYAGHIIWKKGKIQDNVDLVGVAAVRTDYSEFARKLQTECFNILIKEDNYDKMVKYIQENIDRCLNNEFDYEYISIPDKLTKPVKDYASTSPKLRGIAWATKNLGLHFPVGDKMLKLFVKNGFTDVICFHENEDLEGVEIKIDQLSLLERSIFLVVEGIFKALDELPQLEQLRLKTTLRIQGQTTLI